MNFEGEGFTMNYYKNKNLYAVKFALFLFLLALACKQTDRTKPYQLSAPVQVIIDECGTPHIFAQNEEDAFYTLGWIQAHFRLFQIDMSRRMAVGRTSEIFPDELTFDRFVKGLGFAEFSKRTYSSFEDTGIAKKIKIFIDGVNRYIDDAIDGREFGGIRARIPPQYQILGILPEKLRPEEVVAIGKLRAFALSSSLFTEGIMKIFQALFGLDFERKFTLGSLEKVSIVDTFPRSRLNPFSSFDSFEIFSFPRASNNFVISGRVTKTGYSYVENDPHLPVPSPAVWLPIHIETPTYSAKGFTFPGVPIVIIGGGKNVCWGVTVVAADVSDVLLTKVKKEGEKYYVQWGKSWKEAEAIEEIIKVKKGSSFEETKVKYLLVPDLGTIVEPTLWMQEEGFTSSMLDVLNIDVKGDENLEKEVRNAIKRVVAYGITEVELGSDTQNENSIDNYAVLFVWTGFKPTSEVAAFYSHPKAKDVFEAISFHRFFQAGAQNFIVADTKGNIAYYPHADYPIRSFEKPYFPEVSERGYWQSELNDDFTPRAINPESGYIVTANNDPIGTTFDNDPANDRFYFGPAYDIGPRAKRGVELIEQSKFYIDELTVAKIINDTGSPVAQRFLPLFFKFVSKDDIKNFYPELSTDMLSIYESLEKWDYIESANSRETLYFESILHMSIAKMVWDNFLTKYFPTLLKDALKKIFPTDPGRVDIFYQIGLPPLTNFAFRVFMNYEVSLRIFIPMIEGADVCNVSPLPSDVRIYFLGQDLCPKDEFMRAVSDLAAFLNKNARICVREENNTCVEYRNICKDGLPQNCVLGDFAGIRLKYMYEFPGSENFEPKYNGRKYFPRSMGTALFYAANFDLMNFSPINLVKSNGNIFTRSTTDWYIKFAEPDPQKDYIAWDHEKDAQSLHYYCVLKPTGTEIWYAIPGGASDDPSDEYFALMATSWACSKEWLEGVTEGHCAIPQDIVQKLKEKLGVQEITEKERMLSIFSKMETDFEKLINGDYWVSPVCTGKRRYLIFNP